MKAFKAKWSHADILINNAGIATKGDSFNSDIVKDTFKINFYGTVELSEKFVPYLKPNGKIITLGSRAGLSTIIKNEAIR